MGEEICEEDYQRVVSIYEKYLKTRDGDEKSLIIGKEYSLNEILAEMKKKTPFGIHQVRIFLEDDMLLLKGLEKQINNK